MRALLVPLLLLIPVAGCTDSLGLGHDCSAQKAEVRFREGGPPDRSQKTEIAGDYTERWYYDGGATYTFRWGVSYEGCQVDGGGLFSRIPITG
jgi:hypothetical protein